MSALQIRRVIPIGIGPGAFPIVLASLLGLLGLVLILRRPARVAQGTGGPSVAASRVLSGVAAYALLAAFTLAAFDRLGFVATGAIVVLAVGRLLGAGWAMLIAVAGIAPVLIHLVFVHAFSVPLPAGILDAVLP
jgi:putative tricarboxylic transport membrane protein